MNTRVVLDEYLARENVTDADFDATCGGLKAMVNDGEVSLNNPKIDSWIRENKKRLAESITRRQRSLYRRTG